MDLQQHLENKNIFNFATEKPQKFEHFSEKFQHLQFHDFSNAFSRLILVSFLLVFNLFEILRSVFFRKQNHCLHSCVYSALLLISNLYLLWWLPYLFTSYRFGSVFPVMTSLSTHCGFQHELSLVLSTSILVILVYRSLFESFSRSRAKFLSQAFFVIWILPQFIYSGILEFSSHSNALYMVNGLNKPEKAIFFLNEDSNFQFNKEDDNNNTVFYQNNHQMEQELFEHGINSWNGNTSGVMLCVHRLTSNVVHGMTWHYIALIVPLTSLLIICTGAKRFSDLSSTLPLTFKNNLNGALGVQYRTTTVTPRILVKCHCSTDIIVTTILFSNFAWLLVGRPLSVLMKLLEFDLTHPDQTDEVFDFSLNETDAVNAFSNEKSSLNSLENAQSFILDFGTHFILFMMVILLPFSRQLGLLSSPSTS